MELRLIVIRTSDPKKLAEFYAIFGCAFQYHQHGNGPFHYSTALGEIVLEIYPLTKTQTVVDKNLRLGFALENFDAVITELKKQNITFSTEPAASEFGFMAVIQDPDGRKIELYQK
ncbi:MAG: VOC family protein [Flavobacteriales bacterium]